MHRRNVLQSKFKGNGPVGECRTKQFSQTLAYIKKEGQRDVKIIKKDICGMMEEIGDSLFISTCKEWK
jgi:hypothetical protein